MNDQFHDLAVEVSFAHQKRFFRHLFFFLGWQQAQHQACYFKGCARQVYHHVLIAPKCFTLYSQSQRNEDLYWFFAEEHERGWI